MITIKQIADLCGVSRGTVDRVINKRGNVKPDTCKLVMETIERLGYQPNPAGKALAARKNNPVIGVLLTSDGNPFFDEVIRGLKVAEEKYTIYGVKVVWRFMRGYSVKEQCSILDEMRPQVNALIFNPINTPEIAAKINDFVNDGIFVVTLNNDIDNSQRHCYVGSDYFNGGRTAAGLLRLIIKEHGYIGVVMGAENILGHNQRLDGFKEVIDNSVDCEIIAVEANDDDDILSYEKTKQMLLNNPQLNALFIVAAGVYGACRAVLSLGREKELKIIVFDTVPTTVDMMEKNVITAAIYQHPYRQGRRAMEIVFEYLVNGIAPNKEKHIMKNEIKLLENL